MEPAEAEVLAANQAFYEAFGRGDFPVLDALWAHRAPVSCVHPGRATLHGRREVMATWRSILEGGARPAVRCARATARVVGEAAFVVCAELIDDAELAATNLFVREDGAWRMVHHQASAVHRRPEPRPPSGVLN